MIEALIGELDVVASDDGARVLVLAGEGSA